MSNEYQKSTKIGKKKLRRKTFGSKVSVDELFWGASCCPFKVISLFKNVK